jgi:CBS domain-containing protein
MLLERTGMENRTVFEAKRLGVFHREETCRLGEAARLMVDEDISSLVVVDSGGYLSGIITRTDLLRALLTGAGWEDLLVRDYMAPHVVTVPPNATLRVVAEMMLERQIHRVVVVREEEGKFRPISVISAGDIVYHMVNS